MTPFCTQFTYQGQIDENFNLEYNRILVDPIIVDDDLKEAEKARFAKLDRERKDKIAKQVAEEQERVNLGLTEDDMKDFQQFNKAIEDPIIEYTYAPKPPVKIFLQDSDELFRRIKDYTLDQARRGIIEKIKEFNFMMRELEQVKEGRTKQLVKLAEKRKQVDRYEELLLLSLNMQQKLQKNINFSMFEFEQVSV